MKYVINLVIAVLILFIGLILSKIIVIFTNRVLKMRNIDVMIVDFFSIIFRYSIIIFTIIVFLNWLGIKTSPIITIIGAAGLAIGLAMQNSLSNFAAGVLLVILRHFRVGDYVDFSGIAGTVLVVEIFSTTLRTKDGKIVIIPNSKIITNNIINFSKEPNRLIEVIIGVSYDSNINLVKKLILDVLNSDKRIIHKLGVVVRLNDLGSSSMNFIIQAWVPRKERKAVISDLLEDIKEIFDNNRIVIPYPQVNVHFN